MTVSQPSRARQKVRGQRTKNVHVIMTLEVDRQGRRNIGLVSAIIAEI